MNSNPAIVISAYNRPHALQRLLHSIAAAHYESRDITLIISIDQSERGSVNAIAENFRWENGTKQIIAHPEHLGLKRHILFCGALAKEHNAVIVLEDDLMVSTFFYDYASEACQYYKNDPSIAGISLYNYQVAESCFLPFKAIDDGSEVYFMQVASSWGQLWTKAQWEDFETWFAIHPDLGDDASIPLYIRQWGDRSWKKHFIHYLIACSKYFVFPRLSLSTNFEDEGTNASTKQVFQVPLQLAKKNYGFRMLHDSVSVYDAWFELNASCIGRLNKALEGYTYEVDLYGTKEIVENSFDYILTSKQGDHAERSFSTSLFPLETNVALNLAGIDIGLYKKRGNRFRKKASALHNYLDRFHDEKEYGVSVIIPVESVQLNDLKRTIDSVMRQTISVIECLLLCPPSHEEALKQFALSYDRKLDIIVHDTSHATAALLHHGLSCATNGIITWVMPGSVYTEHAFADAHSIFKTHQLVAWIAGLEACSTKKPDLNNLEITPYRLNQQEIYKRLAKRHLNTDTQLQFFRNHSLKEFSGSATNLHDLFFYMAERYPYYLVVAKPGERGKNTFKKLSEAETAILLTRYSHFESGKAIPFSPVELFIKVPFLLKNSKYLLSRYLKQFPDVLREDEKHHTFYFSKF
jgi:hypothetical protein